MLDKHLIAHTRPLADPANIILWKDKRVTVLMPGLIRVEEGSGAFTDEATQKVWFRDMPAADYTAKEEEGCLVIRTDRMTLTLRETLEDSCVAVAHSAAGRPQAGTCSAAADRLPGDAYTAAMPSGGDFRKLFETSPLPGTYRTLDNCNGDMWIPYEGDVGRARHIPLDDAVVARSGHALLDDSASLLLLPDGTLKPRDKGGRDIYVFGFGVDYREAVRALYAICGAPPVIPRFALGNWWSRYHAYSDKEYLDLMDSFISRNLPFTIATIDMDWHASFDRPEGADYWTGYTWNKALFPDYRAFLRALHERNLKVTLNLHPALGVLSFEQQYEEMARRNGVDPASGEAVEFDFTSDDYINSYFDVLHKPYEKDGVDFWWIDWQQGTTSRMEGLDPLWALNHYHSLDIAKEKDQLILSRYAGPGSHRYALGFSGDTYITWDTIAFLPYFTASATNTGYSWWSHDIGGHMMGEKDDELYVRFLQFGVFSPINRLHSTNNDLVVKDPAAYPGGADHVAGEFLRLRHRLIPFLYSAAIETAENAKALIEPMYYDNPDEEGAYLARDQYLFADRFIAAPVTKKSRGDGYVTTPVWLPEGRYTDVFTGNTYTVGKGGPRFVDMTRGLESFPLLAKAGSFLVLDGRYPSCPEEQNSIDLPDALDVLVFSGDGSFTLKEDDAQGKRQETGFTVSEDCENREITVTVRRKTQKAAGLAAAAAGAKPQALSAGTSERRYTFELRNIYDGEVKVLLSDPAGNTSQTAAAAGADRLRSALSAAAALHGIDRSACEGTASRDITASCRIRRDRGFTIVSVPAVDGNAILTVKAKEKASGRQVLMARTTRIISTFEMDNGRKQQLYAELDKALTPLAYEGALCKWTLPENDNRRLLELVACP